MNQKFQPTLSHFKCHDAFESPCIFLVSSSIWYFPLHRTIIILSKNLRGSVSLLHILVINYSTPKRLNVEQKYILTPIQGELREGLYDTYMSCYLQYMNSKQVYDNVETKTVLSTVSLTISTSWKKKCQRIQGTTWCLLG